MKRILPFLALISSPALAAEETYKYALITRHYNQHEYASNKTQTIVLLPKNSNKNICKQVIYGEKEEPNKLSLQCLNEIPKEFNGVLTQKPLPNMHYAIHSQKTDYIVVDLITIYSFKYNINEDPDTCKNILKNFKGSYKEAKCIAPINSSPK